MKCPYCNKEMEKGYFKNGHITRWGKTKKFGFSRDDIKITKDTLRGAFVGYCIEAHYCRNCKKFIVPFDESNT